jgi:hypothetical protein
MTCNKCNHEHQGKRLGHICIGCPCDERPGCEHVRYEDGECITCGALESPTKKDHADAE